MDTPQIDDLIVWLGAVSAAFVAVVGAIVLLKRLLLGDVISDIHDMKGQLHSNGGSSLRDAIDRIEEKQKSIQADLKEVRNKVDDHISWHLDRER